jgi:hypothetical protein
MGATDRYQVGVKTEVTYGTAVTPDRFYEYRSCGVRPRHGRIVSTGMRAGHRVRRNDRQVPWKMGGSGPLSLEVLSKGFGWWLVHLLGTSATGAANGDGMYTHTGTVGSLKGDAFTFQENKPFVGDSDQAFTFEGGKIPKWKIANKVGELLVADLELDFEDYATGTALASASYPAGTVENLSFVGGFVQIADTDFAVTECEVTVDNGLNVDRRFLRSSGLKKEPLEGPFRAIGWKLVAEWEDLTQFNRYAAAVASSATAKVELEWRAPTAIGGTSYPGLKVTIDEASFDDVENPTTGPAELVQTLTGAGLYDGSTAPITVEYFSADATA